MSTRQPRAASTSIPVLLMRNISKRFPGVQALHQVSFDVLAGEVHALLGENGAGKSTLMKILAGVYPADSGEILLRGDRVSFASPYDAWQSGISTIHQELMLVPQLTVAENVFLGSPPRGRWGTIDRHRMFAEAQDLLDRLQIDTSPRALVGDLPVALQQMVEIAKALRFDADLIVMDEPTSALSQHEIDILFERIRRLRAEGRSVVFISHKLDEVFELCDRVTVLRDGEHIATEVTDRLSNSDLIRMMVGRDITQRRRGSDHSPGAPVLEVQNLTIDGQFYDVSFALRAGEILGIAGLVGAGRTDLARALFGAEQAEQGRIRLHGHPLDVTSPRHAIQSRIGFVPENRKEQGLLPDMSVKDNIVIATTRELSIAGILIPHRERKVAASFVERLAIRTPSLDQTVVHLSGGNQQKVILARWLAIQPDILIVDEATRGIDVGAKDEIHALLARLAADGVGVILISSEMEELLAVSDRILVMREGYLVGEFAAEDAQRETIAAYALGAEGD